MIEEFSLQLFGTIVLVPLVIIASIVVVQVANARSRKIRQAAEQMGLTYWKGYSSPRYDDSIMLGQRKAGIQDGIVSGSHIEALQLLNPVAMHELIETFTAYDFEIVGNQVYLFSLGQSDSFMSVESIQQRLDTANNVKQFMINHMSKI